MTISTRTESRAVESLREMYWGHETARFHRLQRMIEIYVKMLKWIVHASTGWQLGEGEHPFCLDRRDLAALNYFTLADDEWRARKEVLAVHCTDEVNGRFGALSNESLVPNSGTMPLEAFQENDSLTSIYFRAHVDCLPSLVIFLGLKKSFIAVEKDLLAVQLQWGGPPLFQNCQDGHHLLAWMRRKGLTPTEVLEDLDAWRYNHIEQIESAQRHAGRADKGEKPGAKEYRSRSDTGSEKLTGYDEIDLAILGILRRSSPRKLINKEIEAQLASGGTFLDRKSLGQRLQAIATCGHISRPNNARRGWVITIEGASLKVGACECD